MPHEQITNRLFTEQGSGFLAGEHPLRQRGREMLQGGGGSQIGLGREQAFPDGQAPLRQALVPLRRVAQGVEPVVENPVLAAVDRFLPNKASDLSLERGVRHLITEVPYRAYEE